jgi:hypothetical protein
MVMGLQAKNGVGRKIKNGKKGVREGSGEPNATRGVARAGQAPPLRKTTRTVRALSEIVSFAREGARFA